MRDKRERRCHRKMSTQCRGWAILMAQSVTPTIERCFNQASTLRAAYFMETGRIMWKLSLHSCVSTAWGMKRFPLSFQLRDTRQSMDPVSSLHHLHVQQVPLDPRQPTVPASVPSPGSFQSNRTNQPNPICNNQLMRDTLTRIVSVRNIQFTNGICIGFLCLLHSQFAFDDEDD